MISQYVLSLLLVSMVAGTLAIHCYECDGRSCKDPFFPTAPRVSDTCSKVLGLINPHSSCVKLVDKSGNVKRSCSPVCVQGCILGVCTYCCTGDHCNGGTTVTTSLVAMGVALLAAFLFSRQ